MMSPFFSGSSRLTWSWIDGEAELEMRTVIDFCPPSNVALGPRDHHLAGGASA